MCSTMGIKEAPQNTIWIRDETGRSTPFHAYCLLLKNTVQHCLPRMKLNTLLKVPQEKTKGHYRLCLNITVLVLLNSNAILIVTKVIIHKSRGEVSLVEQATIENVSAAYLKFIIIF